MYAQRVSPTMAIQMKGYKIPTSRRNAIRITKSCVRTPCHHLRPQCSQDSGHCEDDGDPPELQPHAEGRLRHCNLHLSLP